MEKVYKQDVEKIFELSGSSPNGLSYPEAKKRLEENGKNAFTEAKKPTLFSKFIAQFKDVLIVVLLVSAVISFVMTCIEQTWGDLFDVFFILVVVIINAIIGVVQENKSDKALDELKNMTKPFSTVIRNGKVTKIKSEDVVVGDVVVLEAGDIVCADLRLFEVASLKIEESALTGESLAIEKNVETIENDGVALGDCSNMAFMGSVVTYGRGKGIVVATGMNTEMGKIASALQDQKVEPTPLTKRMKKTNIIITIAILIFAVIIFVLDLFVRNASFVSAFMLAVCVAVSAIPEGLPACLTITMANGMKKMSKQNAIVKRLPAVETLGSTQVICSDKTGTLTLNRMTIKKVFTFDSSCEQINNLETKNNPLDIKNNLVLTSKDEENASDAYKMLKENRNMFELMRCMLLCNDVQSKFEEDNILSIGDPTEVALVRYGYSFGFSKEFIEGQYQRIGEIPFDSERKLMSTINVVNDENIVFTKGAIDNILARSSRILDNGKIRRITEKDKELILSQNFAFADEALRVLGFAYRKADNVRKYTTENTENDLIFIGLVGMIDPPRDEVKDAIRTCKNAGITTIMITGDHKDTAFAIARELEIATSKEQVITGKELDVLTDEEFARIVENYRVYARVNPEHKVKIVKVLQSKNKIVAMTGDGVNDAPSIKAADIGVGMGITGTDVTKNAADLILTDDNFATIVGAVKEGRRIYSNILKIFQFFVGTNIAEALLVLVFNCILGWTFWTPALILWINVVADSFVGLALGFEESEKGIMLEKPKRTNASFFSGESGKMLFYTSFIVMGLVVGVMMIGKYALGLDDISIVTMSFVTLCIAELFHSYDLKSDTESVFTKNVFKNKTLNWAFLVSLILSTMIVLIPWPFMQNAFGVCSLSPLCWLVCIAMSFLIIPFTELYKVCLRKERQIKKAPKKVKEQKV